MKAIAMTHSVRDFVVVGKASTPIRIEPVVCVVTGMTVDESAAVSRSMADALHRKTYKNRPLREA